MGHRLGLVLVMAVLGVVALASSAFAGRPQPTAPDVAVRMPGVIGIAAGDLTGASPQIAHLGVETDVITFGRLDPETGEIVDGQYLVWLQVDLGDAPLSSMTVWAWDAETWNSAPYTVTPENPSIEVYTALAAPNGLSGGSLLGYPDVRFWGDATASVGERGEAVIRWALVDDITAKIRHVPGVTAIVDVVITDATSSRNGFLTSWQLVEVGGAW